MDRTVTRVAVVASLLVAGALASASRPPRADEGTARRAPAGLALSDGASSIDALLQSLLDALAREDVAALHRLRVNEREYRQIILPGSAREGQPPRRYDAEASRFFWELLDTKSLYAGSAILRGLGGRSYTLKAVRYADGHRRYAWYDAYATSELTLADETGQERELLLGSIAHVNGHYKFIGLLGDR